MKNADTDPGIESPLIDLSAVPLERLRGLNSAALHQAMHHVLERTRHPRITRVSGSEGAGERID